MDFNRDTGNWEEKCKVGAVSYTHLMTVRIGNSHVLFASGNLHMLARLQGVDTYNAVSYTHLDVYKRQRTVATAM